MPKVPSTPMIFIRMTLAFIIYGLVFFGSLWGLIPAVLVVIMLIIRTYLEDTTLQKELPGYKEYAKKTKFMLIPGLW